MSRANWRDLGTIAAAALLAALLAACAGAPQRPPQPALVVTSSHSEALLKNLREEVGRIELRLPELKRFDTQLADGELRIDLPASALFEPDEAQLKLGALKPLAGLAQAIAAYGATVIHVVGLGNDVAAAELAERRAATIAEDFVRQGLVPTRVRSESRIEPGLPEPTLELVLRPVIEGAESQAWMPPGIPAQSEVW